jgi:hypothetical protein
MKMNNAALIWGALLSLWLPAAGLAEVGVGEKLSMSITNKHGDVFTKLTVAKILGDGLVLDHKAGQVKVKYADLPQAVREKYEPLAASAANKEKQDRESTAAFAAGLRQGAADIAKARALREKQPKVDEPPTVGNLAIEIPNQGWKITVLNPGLRVLDKQSSADQFVYRAFGRDNFEISIFVEKPSGKGAENTDVFNYYWPKASRNPLIDEKSVKTETKEKFVKVSYTSLDIPNANYYFAFKDRWIDVHISGNRKWFADFEAQLSYGQ